MLGARPTGLFPLQLSSPSCLSRLSVVAESGEMHFCCISALSATTDNHFGFIVTQCHNMDEFIEVC